MIKKIRKRSSGLGRSSKGYVYDLNKEGFAKDEYRTVQLVGFFHMLIQSFGGETYNEIAGEEEAFYIPYSFGVDETLAICITHGMKMLYIEFNEDQFIEITFDEILFQLPKDLYKECLRILDLVQFFDDVPDIFYLKFDEENKVAWQRIILNEYDFAMLIGNNFIKNGHIAVHPLKGEEFEAKKIKDVEKFRGNIEYLVVRSNIYKNKLVLFNHKAQDVTAIGFFPEEKIMLERILLDPAYKVEDDEEEN